MKLRTRLHVEQLGDRILPSAVGWGAGLRGLGSNSHTAVAQDHHHHLTVQGDGTFTTGSVNPDVGRGQELSGAGNFKGLGAVTISGSVQSVGFVAHGHATGTITLTNAQGSVTLGLVGPRQDGFSPLPSKFEYAVVAGTGAYSHWTDHGTLSFSESFTTLSSGTFHISIK